MARKTEVRYVNFYTAGSTAYKFEPKSPAQPKKKVQLPKPKRQKKIVIPVDPVAIGGIVLVSIMLIMMIVGLFQFGAAQKQASEMQDYVARLENRNAELDAQYRAGFDSEEVRRIAEAMGMIPMEQAPTVQITVTEPQPVKEPTALESVWIFLTGLFA